MVYAVPNTRSSFLGSDAYPYVDVPEDNVTVGHEAMVSRIGGDQLSNVRSRGMTEERVMAMIVGWLIEPIARELPIQYALELDRLIELLMEGSGQSMTAGEGAAP